MRRAARIDGNHQEIVDALRRAGCSVVSLAACGHGVPDILIGVRGRTFLAELKDGSKPPSAQKLTKLEQSFHASWRGQVAIIESVSDALRLINGIPL